MTNAIAETIVKQIGNRAFVMLGAQNLMAGHNFIQFKIRGSKTVSHIQVTLDPTDTYTVSFMKMRNRACALVANVTDVQVSDLHKVIESATGLYTSL